MKVVRPVCCGLDVHKATVVATVASTGEGGSVVHERRSFSTMYPDLVELRGWLAELGCPAVCMESTGKYWIPVFNVLEGHVEVVLTHPKYVRAIKGKKTDAKDSEWIADLFRHDLVRSSFIPPREVRELREISRYRAKLIGARTAEKNRYQNCLTESNIGLGEVLSDALGKSARAVAQHLAAGGAATRAAIAPLLKGSAKRKLDLVLEAVEGCGIRADQGFKMGAILRHVDQLDEAIAACEAELLVRMAPHRGAVELLCTAPGIQPLSAMLILSEIGFDMSAFGDSAHLCSWAGLVPGCNESGGKKKSVRIGRAGKYLKPLLLQCAFAAIRSAEVGTSGGST